MHHSRREVRERLAAFLIFVDRNPPKMPASFTHAEYKRVVKYAKVAFASGYNTGQNDLCRDRPSRVPKRGRRNVRR
jgi:hypothetical protein